MSADKKPSLGEFADEHEKERMAENAAIARKLRAANALLKDREEELAEAKALLAAHEALDEATIAPPKWLTPKPRKGAQHKAIASLVLTDIHWGEKVEPEEVGWVNCYNLEIAEQRIRRTAEGCIKLCRDYLSGVEYEGLSLMLGGDLISGRLHEGLKKTDLQTPTESVIPVMEAILAAIEMLADHFGQVAINAVTGNHGRNTKKPEAKRRVAESFDALIYRLIARELRGDDRITMRVAPGADAHFQVYDTRYVLTHGDEFRGGSGIAGALSPLLLGTHRKQRRDQHAEKITGIEQTWDVMVLGHFHQSIKHDDFIVSGAVIGYNEFARSKQYKPEIAQAAMWLTTPERGVTAHMPVHLQDREAEGW